MNKRLILLASILLFIITTSAHAQVSERTGNDDSDSANLERMIKSPHQYDVIPGTEKWNNMKNAEEKREACYVSKEEAEKMTTPALLETVLQYPLLVDIFAYDDIATGFTMVSKYCPGIMTLINRNDAIKVLGQFEKTSNGVLRSLYIQCIGQYITKISGMSDDFEGQSKGTATTVYTPKNTPVAATHNRTWTDSGFTYNQALAVHYAYQQAYPSISVIASVHPGYNCHAYAWYSQSLTTYWIPNPTAYITDGSYSSSSCINGRKVTYYTSSEGYIHSGIVATATSSYSTTRIISKWGVLGLYNHYVDDCPYYSSGVTIQWWVLN